MIKGFKIRIYPTKEQEQLIWKHIKACRNIWNYMLGLQIQRHENGEKYLSGYDMEKLLPTLKKQDEFAYLNEVSAASLQITCFTLNAAYKSFFGKRSKFPKFKSKEKSKPAYPVRADRFCFSERFVCIEKIGRIKYKSSINFPQGRDCKFSNPHISFSSGKYILSFGMECENPPVQLTDKSMGIDLGIKELAVASFGDEQLVFSNINKSKKIRDLKRKLKHTQRSISRKYEASKARTGKYEKTKNIEREQEKLRKFQERLNGIRHNYLHQTTHKLVSELPARVVMEDLDVSQMLKNKHLSKYIAEQNWYEFIRQMKYKCEWNGIDFTQVSQFYPSSKTCSRCGNIKHDLKLSDRTYICSNCGLTIDRDLNAAINLSRYEES